MPVEVSPPAPHPATPFPHQLIQPIPKRNPQKIKSEKVKILSDKIAPSSHHVPPRNHHILTIKKPSPKRQFSQNPLQKRATPKEIL
jgi:hypothetical protein